MTWIKIREIYWQLAAALLTAAKRDDEISLEKEEYAFYEFQKT